MSDINRSNRKKFSENENIFNLWPKIVEYIGLSEYESKIYLSLIELGTSGARKLSINSDVPRTKVYGTVKNLLNYDLAYEIPGNPKKYVAKTPKESFQRVLNLEMERTEDFRQVIEKLDYICKETKGHDIKEVWYLGPEENINKKLIEVIRQTKKNINIVTTGDGLEILFNSSHKLLDEMQEKGIEIMIYTPLDPKKSVLARELSYIFQVKKIDLNIPILYINSDNTRILLTQMNQNGKETIFKNALYTEENELIETFNLLLNYKNNINKSKNRDLVKSSKMSINKK